MHFDPTVAGVSMSLRLERLVYESTATGATDSLANLATILAESERNNDRDGLTGALAAHKVRKPAPYNDAASKTCRADRQAARPAGFACDGRQTAGRQRRRPADRAAP